MKTFLRYLLTGIVVLVAIALVLYKYRVYVTNPWTRDGQVQAQVIQLAPRVSGPIVKLPIRDNQFVKAGDLLFEIDRRTFEADLAQARAELDNTRSSVAALEKQVEAAIAAVRVSRAEIRQAESSVKQLDATIEKNKLEYERQKNLLPERATSRKSVQRAKASFEVSEQQRIGAVAGLEQAKASLVQSEANVAEMQARLGVVGDQNSQVRVALAAVRHAELNLEFTEVRASVDGYVTNLKLRLGSQAVANQPALALVDAASFWVHGFFKENAIADIRAGDRAIVTLMTYGDIPIEGRVESLGWGIAQQDGSTGFELLPNVSATFEWIRLAQRVPVRVRLMYVPEEIKLRVGTTASVLVMTGTAGKASDREVPAAPSALR